MPDQTAQPLRVGPYRARLTDRAFAAFRWRLATLLALTTPPHRPPAPSDRPPDTGLTDGRPPVCMGADDGGGRDAGDGERVRVGQLV
jgi:hypothetical protein